MSGARSTNNATVALERLVAKLVQARKAAGLTQADMVEKLKKKHQSQIAKIENHEHKLHLEDFVRWARAVGEDPAALLQQFERDMSSRPRVRLKGFGPESS